MAEDQSAAAAWLGLASVILLGPVAAVAVDAGQKTVVVDRASVE